MRTCRIRSLSDKRNHLIIRIGAKDGRRPIIVAERGPLSAIRRSVMRAHSLSRHV